tara:strand:- start:357 stop:1220 length:864 start_codon:yes stop_codon:yes gene_type:complete
MIDRKELAEELILRENVRKAISVILQRRDVKVLQEQKNEVELRSLVRDLIAEGQSAVANVAKHDSTGINTLEDLLKNTNILSVLETGYKSLTTKDEDELGEGQTKQRLSYQNHILNAVVRSLAPEQSRKNAGEDVEIAEEIDLTISDDPTDDPDFIDVEDKEEVEVDPREEFGIEGEDKTGRNRSFTDFQDIEKNILTNFDDLDNPQDIALFEEYLIKNLVLYFEKWEAELVNKIEPPPEAASAELDDPAPAETDDDGADAETDMPAFELQEIMKFLDIDDIIENLL